MYGAAQERLNTHFNMIKTFTDAKYEIDDINKLKTKYKQTVDETQMIRSLMDYISGLVFPEQKKDSPDNSSEDEASDEVKS